MESLVRAMRGSIGTEGEGSLFGSGPGAGVYEGMFDEGVAAAVAPRLSFGLKEALMRQLDPARARDSSLPASPAGGKSEVQPGREKTPPEHQMPQVPGLSADSRIGGSGFPSRRLLR